MIEKRFTLRNEYFGGILHDSKETKVDILTHQQYNLIRDLNSEQGRKKAKQEKEKSTNFERLLLDLISGNALDKDFNPVNVRSVVHPIPLPPRTLASPVRIYDTYGFACNMHCKRCSNESGSDGFNKERRSVSATRSIMQKCHDAGTMEWRFTGGEPTVNPNFLESVHIAKSLGMSVMLNTNGWWEDAMVDPILNAGITEIIISIEGSEPVHDRLRKEGGYAHIMQTIDAIQRFNSANPERAIRVTLNQTVGKANLQDVEHIVKLGAKLGFFVNFVPTRPYGRAKLSDLLTTQDFMSLSRTIQALREEPEVKKSRIKVIHKNMDLFNPDLPNKSAMPYPFNYSACGALSTGLGLCPDGRTDACSFLIGDQNFVGMNLANPDVSIYDAWLDPKFEVIRQAEKVGCQNCEYYMQQCEGKCYAMVLAEGGKIESKKLLGTDRNCFRAQMEKADANETPANRPKPIVQ